MPQVLSQKAEVGGRLHNYLLLKSAITDIKSGKVRNCDSFKTQLQIITHSSY